MTGRYQRAPMYPDSDDADGHERLDTASSQSHYRPYYPGQYITQIPTGETLQADGREYDYDDNDDTETHGSTPINTRYEYARSTVDPFYQDTEAYASGIYDRSPQWPPRSRSPTPAADDEYYVAQDITSSVAYPNMYYHHNIVHDSTPETPTSQNNSLPEKFQETRHFGPAPTGRAQRRNKAKRRVQLTNGNLVVELDVPPRLVLPRRGDPDMMYTRYTAVTCDPDDFEKNGFFLRQNASGRRTELFIVITLYNVRATLVKYV